MPRVRIGARPADIMGERGIDDASKVGIYGLTYKEDVDDVRESPTLQMLEGHASPSCGGSVQGVRTRGVERDVVPNQVHSMVEFLDGLDMVIVMVGHSPNQGEARGVWRSRSAGYARRAGAGGNVYKL